MVLEHDPKHPEMLNIADTHDRYPSLQCRQATQILTNTLKEWSDFELLENSHFVKYIYRFVTWQVAIYSSVRLGCSHLFKCKTWL